MAKLKITQIKSRIGATERQCRNLDSAGSQEDQRKRRARGFGYHQGHDRACEALGQGRDGSI